MKFLSNFIKEHIENDFILPSDEIVTNELSTSTSSDDKIIKNTNSNALREFHFDMNKMQVEQVKDLSRFNFFTDSWIFDPATNTKKLIGMPWC